MITEESEKKAGPLTVQERSDLSHGACSPPATQAPERYLSLCLWMPRVAVSDEMLSSALPQHLDSREFLPFCGELSASSLESK